MNQLTEVPRVNPQHRDRSVKYRREAIRSLGVYLRSIQKLSLLPFALVVLALAIGAPAPVAAAQDRERPGQVVGEVFVGIDDLRLAGLLVDNPAPEPGISPMWGCVYDCWHLRNVTYVGTINEFVTQVKGSPGPMVLTLALTRTVSNSYTATVGIKAETVSAEIGFSVTWSASQTYSSSVNVPAGACRIIKAYNVFQTYTYEIWDQNLLGDPSKVGTGTGRRFIGVNYQQVTC